MGTSIIPNKLKEELEDVGEFKPSASGMPLFDDLPIF